MDLIDLFSTLLVFAALFNYLNGRYLGLTPAIGLFLSGILFSLAVYLLGQSYPSVVDFEQRVLGEVDFRNFLMDGALCFLLFAGVIKLDFKELDQNKGPILFFAFVATLISALVVAAAFYYALAWIGEPVPFAVALVFGALISPTDPVAVLSILDGTSVSKSLKMKIAGESLFNDGIGYVLFVTFVRLAAPGDAGPESAGSILLTLLREVVGGAALGAALGYGLSYLLVSYKDAQSAVIMSLAVVFGGYTLATHLSVSGPITVVVAGVVALGLNTVHAFVTADQRDYLRKFWDVLDLLLNALLFLLIGLWVLTIDFTNAVLAGGAVAVVAVLLARYLSVTGLLVALRGWFAFDRGAGTIMTWGGLRGGISIAMALSLSERLSQDFLVGVTYIVVVFSIVVQGLTIEKVVNYVLSPTDGRPS